MKIDSKLVIATGLLVGMLPLATFAAEDPVAQDMKAKVKAYFDACFEDLRIVAEQKPDKHSFRDAIKPVAEKTDGFFGGTLIDPDFVIVQVYHKKNFLARGYDLKKVEQLQDFAREMKTDPRPQLSEPGHGSLVQPRLVAMRYPFKNEGELAGIVSMMVRTEAFLQAVGLDKASAYRITCRGKLAEQKGDLSDKAHRFVLDLPSTTWELEFELENES